MFSYICVYVHTYILKAQGTDVKKGIMEEIQGQKRVMLKEENGW